MIPYQELLIDKIDPNLRYVEDLKNCSLVPGIQLSGHVALKVEKNGKFYVLKAYSEDESRYMGKETKALKRGEENNIKRVPRLIEIYEGVNLGSEIGFYSSLLKEFLEGYTLHYLTGKVNEVYEKGSLEIGQEEFFKALQKFGIGKYLSLEAIPDKLLIFDEGLKGQLKETVDEFHNLGVSNVVLGEYHILISPDFSEVRLFDFDDCVFEEDDPDWFKKMKKQDVEILQEFLCK